MTDRDVFVELTLQLAQDGREPSAADKARNLAALRARLGLPGAGLSGAGAPSEVHAANAPALGGRAVDESAVALARRGVESGTASRGLWRVVGASTLTGVAGFILGLFVAPKWLPELGDGAVLRSPEVLVPANGGGREGAIERSVERSAAEDVGADGTKVHVPSAGEASDVDGLPGSAEGVSVGAALNARNAPIIGEASGADEASSAAASSAAITRATDSRARDGATPRVHRAARAVLPRARATTPRAAPAPNTPDFLEAVRWLRRAQRAVRRGEGALALGLLDELDGRFPPELLGEDRKATRVLGLCGTGEDERARQLARALLAKSPRSIYAERLRSSCAASALGADVKKNDLDPRE